MNKINEKIASSLKKIMINREKKNHNKNFFFSVDFHDKSAKKKL